MTWLLLAVLAFMLIPTLKGLWDEHQRHVAERRIRSLAIDLGARDKALRAALKRRMR